jgi:hypothetical protein
MIIDERQSLGELGQDVSRLPGDAWARYQDQKILKRPAYVAAAIENAAKLLEQEKQRKRYAAMIAQAQDAANSRGGCGISRTSSMPGGNGYHVITQHR